MKHQAICYPHLFEVYNETTERWVIGPATCKTKWVEIGRSEHDGRTILWGVCQRCGFDEPIE